VANFLKTSNKPISLTTWLAVNPNIELVTLFSKAYVYVIRLTNDMERAHASYQNPPIPK